MKRLLKLEEVIGKKISSARFIDCDEQVAILFSDQSYIVIRPSFYGETFNLGVCDYNRDYELRDAGVISEEEFVDRESCKDLASKKKQEISEKAEFERLKLKYDT
jgi:hypothetical protein